MPFVQDVWDLNVSDDISYQHVTTEPEGDHIM